MINLWEYEYCGKVRIVDLDGKEYIGDAQEVTDSDERSDNEKQESGITVKCDSALIEFYESEISSIENIA